MNKLKSLLTSWLDGLTVKGCKMPTICDIYQLADIYNGRQTEFISSDIKRVLDYCKIKYRVSGIGWKVY